MNKEKFLRLYVKFNIVIGLLLLFFVFLFTIALPTEFKSLIESNVFSITFIQLPENIVINNTPLFVFIPLVLVNLFLLIRVGETSDVEEEPLQTVVFYNLILSLMLIIGQVAFALMLPESVNGLIKNRLLFMTFESGTGSPVHVVFLSYILAAVYFGYNVYVNYQVRIPEVEEEEEIYTAEMIEELEGNTEE